MSLAQTARRAQLAEMMYGILDQVSPELRESFVAWIENKDDVEGSKAAAEKIRELLPAAVAAASGELKEYPGHHRAERGHPGQEIHLDYRWRRLGL